MSFGAHQLEHEQIERLNRSKREAAGRVASLLCHRRKRYPSVREAALVRFGAADEHRDEAMAVDSRTTSSGCIITCWANGDFG
jgi:hypothetical protein